MCLTPYRCLLEVNQLVCCKPSLHPRKYRQTACKTEPKEMRVSWDDQHKADERKIDGTATKRSHGRKGEVAKSEAEFISAPIEKTVMTDNCICVRKKFMNLVNTDHHETKIEVPKFHAVGSPNLNYIHWIEIQNHAFVTVKIHLL